MNPPLPQPTVTAQELHILQHALGLDQYGSGRSYRRHFVTGPGSTDWESCVRLTAMGYMKRGRDGPLTGGDYCFLVTEAGRRAVRGQSPRPPKLSRAKARYRQYLNAESSLPFGEWLRRRCYELCVPW
jgi:hypothetical protein